MPPRLTTKQAFMNAENAGTLLSLHLRHTFWAHILLRKDILNAQSAKKNPGATEDMLPKIAETTYEGSGYIYFEINNPEPLSAVPGCFCALK